MRRQIQTFVIAVVLGHAASAVAHPGIGIVVDSKGNVFYTDLKQVWRIAPDGTRSIAVPNVHTHELYLDEQDNLFGEHLWYEGDATKKWGHRVWRRRADGTIEDVIPRTEGFLKDYSFLRDRAGNMYWASVPEGASDRDPRNRVCKRSPSGDVITLAGGARGHADGKGAAAGFTDIRWMIASPDGEIFVVDLDKVRKIAPDGTVTTLAVGLDERKWDMLTTDPRHRLMGLWPDGRGNVYVPNYSACKVKKIAPDGTVTVFAKSRAPYAPTGVTVAPSGDVLVLEYGSLGRVRVRRFAPDASENKAVDR